MLAAGDDLYAVFREVRPLHLAAARVVTEALAEWELTIGVRAVLEVLHDHGPSPVPGIARALSLPRQDVQRLCDRARERQLVDRRPNPAHRRSPLIALTAEGRRTFTQVHSAELDQLAGLAHDISAQDARTCAHVLRALTDRLRTPPPS